MFRFAFAAAALALVFGSTAAAHRAGGSDATLAFVSQDASTVTVTATFTGHKNVNPYDLWVRLVGLDANGATVGVTDAALRWNEQPVVPDGTTSTVTLAKPAGSVTFSAFVWLFPDPSTPVSNTVTDPAAAAAKPNPGPASISIATLDGVPYSGQTPAFLQTVTWNTSGIPHLTARAQALVVLSCYQDVDNDGVIDTTLGGPDIVYSWVDQPGATFSFSGQGQQSIWSLRGGGPAICRADLDIYPYPNPKTGQVITVLATTGDFPVNG